MEYRISTDIRLVPHSPLYWIEQKVGGDWERLFGTMAATAGEAWELLDCNRKAIVTPEERACLMGNYFTTGSDLA